MVLSVVEMVFPILLLLAVGVLCRKKAILTPEGLAGVKSIVGNVCLPVVLFNAFFTARYSSAVLITFIVVYLGFGIALLAGFALRRVAAPYGKFFPFLVTSAEGGMLGYALYGVLAGEQSGFAVVDLGQTVFAYTIFLGTLTLVDGQTPSAKRLLRNIITNKCCIGMALGILLGATGVGGIILSGPIAGIVRGAISAITAPTSALVLIIVGYELEVNPTLLRPVAATVLSRLVLMGGLLALVSFIIFRLIPYDPALQTALMVMYALPAPFIIPLFADVGDEGRYISTALSVHTLCTVLLFAVIAVYHFL